MRKTDSAYSQTLCIGEVSLHPLPRGCLWKGKLPFPCSLAGTGHTPCRHSRPMASLCWESSPQAHPAAFWSALWSRWGWFLASLCRRGEFFSWVPCLPQAQSFCQCHAEAAGIPSVAIPQQPCNLSGQMEQFFSNPREGCFQLNIHSLSLQVINSNLLSQDSV